MSDSYSAPASHTVMPARFIVASADDEDYTYERCDLRTADQAARDDVAALRVRIEALENAMHRTIDVVQKLLLWAGL